MWVILFGCCFNKYYHQTSGKLVVWKFCGFWKMKFLCSGWPEVNNQPHEERLCKNPVDVHVFCKQPENILKKVSDWKTILSTIQVSLWLGIKQCWLWGPHWRNEARNASTILFLQRELCQGQRFSRTTSLFGEHWFGYALVTGNFLFPKHGNKNWGEFGVKHFSRHFSRRISKFVSRRLLPGFSPNLTLTREAVCAIRQFLSIPS